MKKQYLISSLLILIVCFEYKKPTESNSLSFLMKSLNEQKELFYHVKYHDSRFNNQSEFDIYGLVHLKKNKISGVSNAYFGLNSNFLPNHLESFYLQNQFTAKLSSNLFTDHNFDALVDSLHSPLLLNPEILLLYENEAVDVKETYLDLVTKKTSFLMNEKQLDLIWDTANSYISSIIYHENIGNENKYFVRSWEFQFVHKSDFMTLSTQYKAQNEQLSRQFL